MISDECEERTKQNAGHESKAQNEDLYRKMSEDFDISQEEVFFGKVRKLFFFAPAYLRSACTTPTSYVIRRHPQEAFIHPPPPEPCEAHFIIEACTLFFIYCTVGTKHPLTPLCGLEGPGPFLI